MTKESLLKSWVITNLIGSSVIILIIFLINLILDQIDFSIQRLGQVFFGIFFFFLFGIILTLPHLIYSHVIIRKNSEYQKIWKQIWISMLFPYLLFIIIVVAINFGVYGNPVYELPNIALLGILILHFTTGIFVWRYFLNFGRIVR